jgi:hypothetical protein
MRLTVSLTAAQPEEPNGIRTGRTVRTGVCPEHGDDAARSHGTFLNVAHDPVRKPPGHPGTISVPRSRQTTSGIRHLLPACCRRERQIRRRACGMEFKLFL